LDSDFVWKYGVEKAVFSDLDAPDKDSAVRAMVRILMAGKGFTRNDFELTANAILSREGIGSTGIGCGVAVPHTRHPTTSEPLVGWFVSRDGIDFEALDSEPVDLFCCLVSPQNRPDYHLGLLEWISWLLKREDFRAAAGFGGTEKMKLVLSELQAVDAELASIGAGQGQLREEEWRFRVAAEAGWTRCQEEMARAEEVIKDLRARLAGVGAAAAEEGLNRLDDFWASLLKMAADAKKRTQLMCAIKKASSGYLNDGSLEVQVNGPEVSIRAEARRKGQREHLRSMIVGSLGELSGYRAEIIIGDGVIDEGQVTGTLSKLARLFWKRS
jgi:mannitol/fructose-specific phosphotransferase system IIA component (Ntr-type)